MSNQSPAEGLRQEILETLQVGSSLKYLYSEQADAIMERVTAYAATVEREGRIDEMKALLKQVPMPTLSYEQVENRIAELERQEQ